MTTSRSKCQWITTGEGVTAHVNGDMSDPETAAAIEAVINAAYKRLAPKEEDNDVPAA